MLLIEPKAKVLILEGDPIIASVYSALIGAIHQLTVVGDRWVRVAERVGDDAPVMARCSGWRDAMSHWPAASGQIKAWRRDRMSSLAPYPESNLAVLWQHRGTVSPRVERYARACKWLRNQALLQML